MILWVLLAFLIAYLAVMIYVWILLNQTRRILGDVAANLVDVAASLGNLAASLGNLAAILNGIKAQVRRTRSILASEYHQKRRESNHDQPI